MRRIAAVSFALIVAPIVGALIPNAKGLAQSDATAETRQAFSPLVPLNLVPADRDASAHRSAFRYHILRTRTEAARSADLNGAEPPRPESGATGSRIGIPALAVVPKPGFYPADVTKLNPYGAVITSAVFDNVYVACADGSCWGNPTRFQADLLRSEFIHLVDQYVASRANKRYGLGPEFTAPVSSCTSPSFCSVDDIHAIVHAVATSQGGGNGYSHVINVFLPQGVDTCMDTAKTSCYSPDTPSTDIFCAYHGSTVFPDIGETVFTVEPYQDVQNCSIGTPSPNGELADSTNATLSHETFETITDPDTDCWEAINSVNEAGSEIADECESSIFPTIVINRRSYVVGLEYSNKYHACASVP